MSGMTSTIPSSITPGDLAERLARGEALTVLDVRDGAADGIEAPSATTRAIPAADVLADPDGTAARLSAPIAVLCNRGVTAQRVADALRSAGADALPVEGGVRAWIGVLQARPVELDLEDAVVLQVQRPGRGCLSYVIASGGRALVVDPAPDAGFYVRLAAEHGATVTDVVDTHLHADHLSGARTLADATGAALRLPAGSLERGVADADRVRPLHDGEKLALGDITVRAVALPGHTSDMTGLLVAGRALVGGDSVFADGIARPDLQRQDAEGARLMAHTLHRTLHERVLSLDEDVVLLPGHTHPGVLADPIAPTLGEVRANVPELALGDADAFGDALLAGMPPRPANFEAVIAVNAGLQPFDPELESGGNSCATR